MIGLGLALAQPKRKVLVITGDGEMLMSVGSLATIAVEAPTNLTIAVLDNERFGETGMQKTHTAAGVDLAAIATACGIRTSRIVRTLAEVTESAISRMRAGERCSRRSRSIPKLWRS